MGLLYSIKTIKKQEKETCKQPIYNKYFNGWGTQDSIINGFN